MKKIELNKKTVLLLLIILWCVTSAVFYWSSYFIDILDFKKNVKYEIIYGYCNKTFLDENLYYHLTYAFLNSICVVTMLIFSIVSLVKQKSTKLIGVLMSIQTMISTLLKIWMNYLIDSINNTETIDLRIWICISIIVSIGIGLIMCLKQIDFIPFFLSITVLQVIDTIFLIQTNINFIRVEPITNPNYIKTIYWCINGTIVYVLYWILFVQKSKTQKQERRV